MRALAAQGRLGDYQWIFLRGEIYEAAGRDEEAIADYRQTLELHADHVGATKALKRLGANRIQSALRFTSSRCLRAGDK